MVKISKEIEVYKFRTKLLSQEKDKKSVIIRQLKQKNFSILDENEEKSKFVLQCKCNFPILHTFKTPS